MRRLANLIGCNEKPAARISRDKKLIDKSQNSLTLEDRKPNPSSRKPGPVSKQKSLIDLDQDDERKSENDQPNKPRHRPTRSQEEALRARKVLPGNGKPGSSQSPQRKSQRRPRRNSDSSVLDFESKSLSEEQRKALDAKRRERDRQRREGRDGKDGKERSKSGRPSRRLDIIDQLDATSIYGTGCK